MKSDKDKQIRQAMKEEKARGRRSHPKNTLREREETLAFILDFGTEQDYINLLTNWKIPVTHELIDEFRKRAKEKRGLL